MVMGILIRLFIFLLIRLLEKKKDFVEMMPELYGTLCLCGCLVCFVVHLMSNCEAVCYLYLIIGRIR